MLRKFVTGAALVAALLCAPLPSFRGAPLAGVLPFAAPAFAVGDLNTPLAVTAVSVTNSATSLLAGSTLASEPYKGFFLNPTDGEIAVGGSAVTTATGFLLGAGSILWVEWSRGRQWYGIRTGGSNVNTRIVLVR